MTVRDLVDRLTLLCNEQGLGNADVVLHVGNDVYDIKKVGFTVMTDSMSECAIEADDRPVC